MPHPPLRSRPTSAGATKARPNSADRERTAGPPVARGVLIHILQNDEIFVNHICKSCHKCMLTFVVQSVTMQLDPIQRS